MKVLQVTFSDGKRFIIPTQFIAEERASWFVECDLKNGAITKDEVDDSFKKEVEYALDDVDELEDWAYNNMSWDDVKDIAIEIDSVKVDYEDDWVNAGIEVVEIDD